MSKVLANRLKPIMSKLTGQFPSSFILGRSIMDNVVVAQEALHSLKKKKGSKGGFILKVDLEKAYDRINWAFLKQVLKFTGFKEDSLTLSWVAYPPQNYRCARDTGAIPAL